MRGGTGVRAPWDGGSWRLCFLPMPILRLPLVSGNSVGNSCENNLFC